MAPRYKVTLTEEERKRLESLTHKGSTNSKKVIKARALLLCDAGEYGPRMESGPHCGSIGDNKSYH